jgi:uncharacterized protein
MDEKFFRDLKEKIRPYYEPGGSHAFDHTERVYNMALRLAKGKKADVDTIKAAALLHDVSRLKEDNNEINCHAEHGAEMAKRILEKMNFPKEKIGKVCYAIRVHRHSKGLKAETLEAQILQDADRLDALGAITIARMFSTGGKVGIPIYDPNSPFGKVPLGYKYGSVIHAFHVKILKITPKGFNTKKAKKIAERRYEFVEKFLKQFEAEWGGKA